MDLKEIAALVDKYPDCRSEEKERLLTWVGNTPLQYGPWKSFKKLYKKAEAEILARSSRRHDWQVAQDPDCQLLGALLARLDQVDSRPRYSREVRGVIAAGTATPGAAAHLAWRAPYIYAVEEGEAQRKQKRVLLTVSPWAGAREPRLGPSAATGLGKLLGLVAKKDSVPVGKRYSISMLAGVGDRLRSASLQGEVLELGLEWYGLKTRWRLDVSDGDFPHFVGAGPSSATLAYMKRRGRRLLRTLADAGSPLYVPVVAAMLGRINPAGSVQPRFQWLTLDALFCHSRRFQRQGKGGHYARTPVKDWPTRRTERATELWNERLDLVRELATRPGLNAEVLEFALRVLRANGQEAPVSRATAEAWLEGGVLSRRAAVQFLTKQWLETGVAPAAAVAARIMVDAPARLREELHRQWVACLGAPAGDVRLEWARSVAQVLAKALQEGAAPPFQERPYLGTRRRRVGLGLLTRWPDWHPEAEAAAEFATALVSSGERGLEWLRSKVPGWSRGGWVPDLRGLNTANTLHARFFDLLIEHAAEGRPTAEEARRLIETKEREANRLGWRYLQAARLPSALAAELWRGLMEGQHRHKLQGTRKSFEPVWDVAMEEPAAASLLSGAARVPGAAGGWWKKSRLAWNYLAPHLVQAAWLGLSPAEQTEVAAGLAEEQWQAIRDLVEADPAALLQLLLALLQEDSEGRIASLTHDPALLLKLRQLSGPTLHEFLRKIPADAEHLALGWLNELMPQLELKDALLFAAATHPGPAIRELGLLRLRELQLDIVFAVRLMESELPDAVAAGLQWVEGRGAVAAIQELRELALALLDSPVASVRALGQEFVARHEALGVDALLWQRLGEHSDPRVQSMVALHYGACSQERKQQLAQEGGFVEFESAVLRARGRGRRAKTAVWKLEQQARAVPEELLLELARGTVARDREAALVQLAVRVRAGANIAGVHLPGEEEAAP